jgi:UDP-N-acetylmuramate dehydrogenase
MNLRKLTRSSKLSAIIEQLPKIRGTYRHNADLSKINWFNVGGIAEVMFRPADSEDLIYFLKNKPSEIPVTILGVGSNLLVRDGGINGVVIRLGRGFTQMSKDGNNIHLGAGALSFNAANAIADFGLSGLEFLIGIPGTIGGALAMNAGAYGSDIASVLQSAQAIDESGELHQLSPDDIGYIYRGNTLPDGMIFISCILRGDPSNTESIKARLAQITQMREDTQPIRSKTSGSTFKNPAGLKAWQLIDEAGCRGLKIGGAQVSEKHCNFFINTGNATASDIEKLGEEVRRRVLEKADIELSWEVKIIGNKNHD